MPAKTIRVDPTQVASLFNSLSVATQMHAAALDRHDLTSVQAWNRGICRARDELKAIGITPVGFDHYQPFDLPSYLLEPSNV